MVIPNNISNNIKEASKVIGCFSYTNSGVVFCDGDACVIAGSEELMESYLLKIPSGDSKDIIKKTFQERLLPKLIIHCKTSQKILMSFLLQMKTVMHLHICRNFLIVIK